uniref:Uncharacterized protein n=1 Tax=Branchiostoma floridae TaxID=7739 RepID=C3Y3B1_BRAFL|eukprot:XP_002609168.1 hypothetical protein BRAFLDRAFT_92541 [Branchiostoma floridae]
MATEMFGQANEAFVDENYEKALELYTKAIELDGEKSEFFTKRAQTYIKLEQYMGMYVTKSHPSFVQKCTIPQAHCVALMGPTAHVQWKRRRNQEQWLKMASPCLEQQETVAPPPSLSINPSHKLQPRPLSQRGAVNHLYCLYCKSYPMGHGHDWYQTETHVIVTVMIKGLKKEDVQVDYDATTLSAVFKQPSGTDYVLDLELAHPIVKEKCITKVLSTKVEMKMKKSEGIRWQCLEGDGRPYQYAQWTSGNKGASGVTQYPSSSHCKRDWNKIVADVNKEEKEEKSDGDAALNSFFQQIYSDGNEEVRKAMNKSFVESGGTVLSTNWKDIGKKKVDMKPPDGMEFKKWEI